MIEVASLGKLKEAVSKCISLDWKLLESLREEVSPLKGKVSRIFPRTTTSISLVATDGGENRLRFDPFLIQLIRVVDDSNKEYFLEVVSPTTPIEALDKRHIANGVPQTALGKMMVALGVKSLSELSPMIKPDNEGKPVSPTWVNVYRELVEWAVLFSLLDPDKNYAADILIVRDGLLRSKVFAGDYFHKLINEIKKRLEYHRGEKRNIYIAGVAKKSKVLLRYRLAMALEGILQTSFAAYVEAPREIEEKAYVWPEYARGDDNLMEGRERNKYVGGKMFLVKFGPHPHDPIWPVDIFESQEKEAQKILGFMLEDACNGFPIPYYPLCLQKAHENAALVDFDFEVLQDIIYEALRKNLKEEAKILDSLQLQDSNPAQKRYQ